jgi:hypothetical protein
VGTVLFPDGPVTVAVSVTDSPVVAEVGETERAVVLAVVPTVATLGAVMACR